MRNFRKTLIVILILTLLSGLTPVYAIEAEQDDNTLILDHIPTADFIPDVSPYDGVNTVLSSSEANSANVPGGYSDEVLKVDVGSNSSYAGVTIDLSSLALPVSEIESVTFRVYLAGGTSFRVSNKGAGSWAILANLTSNAWVDYTIKADGTGFNSGGMNMSYFANSNGNFGVFGLGAKNVSCIYIDSITIVLSEGSDVSQKDVTPPVITYNGEENVKVNAGEKFVPGAVTAYDEYDGTDAKIDYKWSEGALDSNGNLAAGLHTLSIVATDKSGNVSILKINVQVIGSDPYAIVLDKLPVIDYIAGVSPYDGVVTEYSESEANAANVPKGFEDSVIKVIGAEGYTGVTFDLSQLEIPTGLVKSITFRVYFTTGATSLRISKSGYSNWIVLSNISSDKWVEYTLGADGTGFAQGKGMSDFADGNGNLGVFGLGTKYGSGIYVDSIVIRLKEDDKTGPVLNFDGKTDIVTSAGRVFLPDVTAYDELEEREIKTTLLWSEGALDSEGKLTEGNHTCVVSAADYYGNTSSVTYNLTVGAPDTEAPNILFDADEIFVPTGTLYRMVITCLDNYDDVDVVEEWSDGAINPVGRLNEGTHTLTLTARDYTGNTTVHVVTVYVTETDEPFGDLIILD